MKAGSIPEWLDDKTHALIEETITMLVRRYPDVLLAIILFGSIARHDERPLDDPYASDVDMLAIFDTTDRLVEPYHDSFFAIIIDALALHLDAPREVNVMPVSRTMENWDEMFLDNVARDGIILYQRGPLPRVLADRSSVEA
jgi:predicted nucleotidyltransferase